MIHIWYRSLFQSVYNNLEYLNINGNYILFSDNRISHQNYYVPLLIDR